LRIRVLAPDGTEAGESNPVTITLGGEKMPPANLVGLQPLTVRTAIPQLTATREGSVLRLSWDRTLPGLELETSSSIVGPNWVEFSGQVEVEGGLKIVRVPLEWKEQYFRLRRVGP
jgi:hypothetical protein